MHCLWITRQDPRPADSGELIYTRGLVGALAAQPDVDLALLAHSAGPADAGAPAPSGWTLCGPIPGKSPHSVFSRLPSDAHRLGNPPMRRMLRQLLAARSWDWILIDQAACGWALGELRVPPPGTRIAYVAHNHEASVRAEVAAGNTGSPLLGILLRGDARKYGILERELCRRADLVTAITPRDRDAFRREFPDPDYLVLPPGYDAPEEAPSPPGADTPRRVVLAGAFQWIAKRRNLETFLDAAAGVFPARGIAFTVAGKTDPEYFRELAARHPWAEFRANVPSMDPILGSARIGLIPEALGGGFKLKALDYIFRGLPVASIAPALSGLPLDHEREAIVADDPAGLVTAVARRIDDVDFLAAAATAAHARCRDAFHWSDRGAALAGALRSS